jgi:hypothetical protein
MMADTELVPSLYLASIWFDGSHRAVGGAAEHESLSISRGARSIVALLRWVRNFHMRADMGIGLNHTLVTPTMSGSLLYSARPKAS